MAELSYPTELMGPGVVATRGATPPVNVQLVTVGRVRRDFLTGGNGRVRSTVEVAGPPDVPVSRRVHLFRTRDGLRVGETWSDPVTGVYNFDDVDTGFTYTAVAYDHTGVFATLATGPITPEPMPS